jgi:hypothetical protein
LMALGAIPLPESEECEGGCDDQYE